MANHLLRDLVKDISPNFFSLLCNEYTDITNKEQLTFCVRWINDNLEAFEDFLGFYRVPDISANTIVSAIKMHASDKCQKWQKFGSGKTNM